jgi:hypothetical protein
MTTKTITVQFTSSGVSVTGLFPTINIYDVSTGTLLITGGSLVEIAGGWYKYDFTTYSYAVNYVFTIDGGATLSTHDRYKYGGNESYEEDTSFGVWEETATNHVSSGTTGLMLNQTKADTATLVVSQASMTTIVNLILQYEKGQTKLNVGAATLTVYASDNTTPIQVFNLLDALGNPSVQEVIERVPTM